jgi:hypothetical protein
MERKTKEKEAVIISRCPVLAFVNSDNKSVPPMPDGKGGALRGTKRMLDRRGKTQPQVRVNNGSGQDKAK